jgi:hypothetical protein
MSSERLIVCIADGSTDSFISGRWARCLCRMMVSEDECGGMSAASFAETAAENPEWKGVESSTWTSIEKNLETCAVLGISQSEKMKLGSSATLLAAELSLGADGGALLSAGAVGDTCLFLIREGQEFGGSRWQNVISFPLVGSDQFSTAPALISSVSRLNKDLDRELCVLYDVRLMPGDLILLMTDALAKWHLAQMEGGLEPWHLLTSAMENKVAFSEFASQLRRTGSMRNDDVTVLSIRVK